ncbi:MAG: 3-deoxy-7-phosphoheptulonate synthase, partial [Chloroflexota bacterium]
MIVEMRTGATKEEVDHVVQRARSLGFDVQLNKGTDKVVVAVLGGNTGQVSTDVFAVLPGVEGVARIMKPYKLASREFRQQTSVVNISGIEIGGNRLVVMAGPCAVESEKQILETARAVTALGAVVVRGGAYKPRTSPFSFQGLKEKGLSMLARVREELGVPIITEVTDTRDVA